LQRKRIDFPLIHSDNWSDFKLPDDIPDDEETCSVYSRGDRARRNYDNTEERIERACQTYPLLQSILEQHPGKLAVCGGFYTGDYWGSGDVDFFFHGVDPEEADQLLASLVNYILDNYEAAYASKVKSVHAIRSSSVYAHIERRQYVTNVLISSRRDRTMENGKNLHDSSSIHFTQVYSFIHRLYPTLGSIIGGFDLGPCMVAYDGRHVYATELGAWSMVNTLMILDISTRSTTFSKRLIKYKYRGFGVVFPGLEGPLEDIFPKTTKKERLGLLQSYMREIGLYFTLTDIEVDDMDYDDPRESYNKYFSGRFDSLSRRRFRDFVIKQDSIGSLYMYRYQYQNTEDSSDYGDWPAVSVSNIAGRNMTCARKGTLSSITAIITVEEVRKRPFNETWWQDQLARPHIPYPPNIPLLELKPLMEVLESMKVNTWVVDNPQRQWTASFNPIITKAGEYWGEYERKNRFIIGVTSDVETMLRYGRSRPDCALYLVSNDMFDLIMTKVCLM
jgi:hypothetical protein